MGQVRLAAPAVRPAALADRLPLLAHLAVVPRRWVVERTFAWLGKFRRLAKNYEYRMSTAENVIYLTISIILLRRRTGRPP